MLPVLSPEGTSTRVPRELGALLTVGGQGLAAGTTLALRWDDRIYTTASTVTLRHGQKTIAVEPLRTVVDAETHRAEVSLVLVEDLVPGQEYTLTAGVMPPHRYPADLVSDPVPTALTTRRPWPDGDASTVVLDRTGDQVGTPWGVALGARWQRATWATTFHAVHPDLVTLRSVGPGPVPVGSRIRIVLDPQVFTEVTVDGAVDGSGAEVSGRGTSSREAGHPTATWVVGAPVAAGDRITLRLSTRTGLPEGTLSWLEPPVVFFTPAGSSQDSQRLTRQESLTSADNVYSAETLEMSLGR